MFFRTRKASFSLLPIMLLLINGGLFTFLTLIKNQEPYMSIDKRWSRSLYETNALSNPVMVLLTRLGSGFFMIPLGLMLYFSYRKTREDDKSKLILVNVLGIRILNALFKQLFKRKPPEWERHIEAGKYGYPSAHTMNAAGFYGLLLYLSGLWKNVWAVMGAVVFLVMIGISRVKLGIHLILDILAGLSSGIFFNLLSIKTYKMLFRR
jgi:membrane-associated phospholipid phosphatase